MSVPQYVADELVDWWCQVSDSGLKACCQALVTCSPPSTLHCFLLGKFLPLAEHSVTPPNPATISIHTSYHLSDDPTLSRVLMAVNPVNPKEKGVVSSEPLQAEPTNSAVAVSLQDRGHARPSRCLRSGLKKRLGRTCWTVKAPRRRVMRRHSCPFPMWASHGVLFADPSHLTGHRGALEQGGGPRPLGDDGGGRQPDGHLATRIKGRVQVVCVMVDVLSDLRKRKVRN